MPRCLACEEVVAFLSVTCIINTINPPHPNWHFFFILIQFISLQENPQDKPCFLFWDFCSLDCLLSTLVAEILFVGIGISF